MRQTIKTALAVVLLTISLAGSADAGPLEDGLSALKREDYATALRLWRPLADQGNAYAQDNLGEMYAPGQGVPQDYSQAIKWYRLAADQGYAVAQYHLGQMYFSAGVPQDHVQAHKWFNLAASRYAASQKKTATWRRRRATPSPR